MRRSAIALAAILGLGAAGVGTLGVVDDDVVDLSNLQRQIVHPTPRIGAAKVESARETLAALNPEVLPRVLRRVDPEYTPEAKKARIAGIVVVEVIVERDCRVGAARVLKPLPFGLSQKAVEAVRQWRFSPATHEGKPIRAFFTVTVDFRPEDE